ncbi:hypothetical protein HGRIS_000177 [Hohenbuehelia grisea]|uniref:NAD(P)-binding protein n=1 Tax=Hohenbuehelia grisea TaxID=104357 RepID=A0ABR3JQE5_9AGAR
MSSAKVPTPNLAPDSRRVALITGSARGIGHSIALRLVQDGLCVVINDIPAKEELLNEVVEHLNGLNPDTEERVAIAVPGDVSLEADVERMVSEAVRVFGRLDVMVANAGFGGPTTPIMDADVNAWESLFAVNIRGVLLSYKHAAKQMVKQGFGGRIIGAGSMASFKGTPRMGAYCAAKAAVRSMTQTLAQELSEHNITVNAYAPGVIETELTKTDKDEALGGPCGLVKKIFDVPNAKVGQPDVVASLVSYLVKPEAFFITGQTISVDGGIHFS